MMKEITVVMPVYKVEKYVSECLDSIINQTFDCFECIIIDDCSPDNSMRLIEEKLAGYKGNISFRIVRNERNEGVSAPSQSPDIFSFPPIISPDNSHKAYHPNL